MTAGIRLDAMTYEDFDLMLQALDALDSKAGSDTTFTMLMGAMLSRSKEEAADSLKKADGVWKSKQHEVRRLKESTSILRAKLILARRELDSQQADLVLNEAGKQLERGATA